MTSAPKVERNNADTGPSLEKVCSDVLAALDANARATLRFRALVIAETVREAADASADPLAPGRAIDAWLVNALGRTGDDLRRGAARWRRWRSEPSLRVSRCRLKFFRSIRQRAHVSRAICSDDIDTSSIILQRTSRSCPPS